MDTSALSPRRGGVAVLAVTLALVAAGVIAFVVAAGVLIVTGSQRVTIADDRAPFLAAGLATAQSAALVFMTQGRGGLGARWLVLIWLVTVPCVLVGTVLALAVAAVAGAPAVAVGMGRQSPGPHSWWSVSATLATVAIVLFGAATIPSATTGATRAAAPAVAPSHKSSPRKFDIIPQRKPRAKKRRGPVPRVAAPAPTTAAPAPTAAAPAPTAAAPAPTAAAPATATPPGPARIIRAYYADLDAHRFEAAWQRLAPNVQSRFGGFDDWRAGYATTVAHNLRDVRTAAETASVHRVTLTLDAQDATACGGTVLRSFAIAWHLQRTPAGWRAVGVTARKVAGTEPAAAC